MTIKVGDRIPEGTITTMGPDGPQAVNVSELFRNRRVVLFAVPGAFTPTCSAKHLPGFVQRASDIKAKGVQLVICLSVNDVFVMDAWGKHQQVGGKVLMAADGSAKLTRLLEMDLDLSERGMGVRSRRYSLVADDGVVTHLNVEAPGAFEVSDAETILKQL